MRITIVTVGSRGDVQPYVALGLGLKGAGHEVTLTTHAPFETFVRSRGLIFSPIPGDPEGIWQTEHGLRVLRGGQNPVVFLRALRDAMLEEADAGFDACVRACQGADLVVRSPLAIAPLHIAEAMGVPQVGAYLQPLTRTRAFAPPYLPRWLDRLGWLSWLVSSVGERVMWQMFHPVANRFRRERLSLPPLSVGALIRRFYRDGYPLVYGFSPHVIPQPADWPVSARVTGYWFLPAEDGWRPDPELEAFVGAGPAPVCVGFGSMGSTDVEALTRLVVGALRQAKQRGIILSGWAKLGDGLSADDVIVRSAVPHDWLFPRCRALVHHGGAGTTAAGLRAGRPTVVVPWFADQPLWGERVRHMGVGPRPIPHKRLSEARLAAALVQVVSDPEMLARAEVLGASIQAEDGVARAVALIERASAVTRPKAQATA